MIIGMGRVMFQLIFAVFTISVGFVSVKVDLVSKKALKPRIGEYILKEVVCV